MVKVLLFGICLLVCSIGGVLLFAAGETNLPQVVILLGPPGSGKGTQAEKLSNTLGIPHISTGDLFRESIGKKTGIGLEAKTYINSGRLVPDEVVLEMLFERVSQPDCSRGYLLDGFPRTIPQAIALDERLENSADVRVLNLKVSDSVIVKRAAGRLTCRECKQIFNKYYTPPKEEKVCDNCGGELYQRPDDKAEVVEKRLDVYREQTEPLIEHYSKKGWLQNFNGEQAPDQVFNELNRSFKTQLAPKS